MNVLVDKLDDPTGWTGTGATNVFDETLHEEYLAGYAESALVLEFPQGSAGDGVAKAFNVNVTGLDQLVVSVWSRNLRGSDYRTFEDCPYEVVINGTERFGLRCWQTFVDETMDIADIDVITSIEFRARTNAEDYLIVSNLVASRDELPRDIFDGLRVALERERDAIFPIGLPVGMVSANAGDKAIDIVGQLGHLWRYAVVRIVEGQTVETHQLADSTKEGFEMTTLFDGKVMLNDFADGEVYLQFPVLIYQTQTEVMFPSMTIYGMEPIPIERGTRQDRVLLAPRPDEYDQVEQDAIIQWPCNVDLASRSLELNAVMADWVRRVMNQRVLWINGRKHAITFQDAAVEDLPTDSFDVLPRLAYTVTVEVKERVWTRTTSRAGEATATFTPIPNSL